MIYEDLLLEMLDLGGFTGEFIDYRGRQQPAMYAQLFRFDEKEDGVSNKRIICIRNSSGGFGNKYVQNPSYEIIIAGLMNLTDTAIVADFADRLYTYFLDTRQNCGIIDVKPASGTPLISQTESGRPIAMVTLNVKIDRGAA